jgi:hypothetical protein
VGIKYFAELNFLRNGKRIKARHLAYMSDNTRHIVLKKLTERPASVMAQKPFRITKEFSERSVKRLRKQPFLALFHPQWYW